MKTQESIFFINEGFGGVCKKCSEAGNKRRQGVDKISTRLLFEGEAETKNPRFSSIAMAKWSDPERHTLVCPICGREEKVGEQKLSD